MTAAVHPFWLYVFIPAGTFCIAVIGMIMGTYPLLKDRMADQRAKRDEKERTDAVNDYVLGREGVPEKGKLPLEGLINQMPKVQDAVDKLSERIDKMEEKEQ